MKIHWKSGLALTILLVKTSTTQAASSKPLRVVRIDANAVPTRANMTTRVAGFVVPGGVGDRRLPSGNAATPLKESSVVGLSADLGLALVRLRAEEAAIFAKIQIRKEPELFFALGRVRYKKAKLKFDHGLLDMDGFLQAIIKKVTPPLKLNLRAWACGSTAPIPWSKRDAGMWQRRTLELLDQVMKSAKLNVSNVPARIPAERKKSDVVGRASWYGGEQVLLGQGTKTHHGPTAKGDTFCMFGQTATYWKAPLGSWVRVRNIRNGRWIDLRVNDTGGFNKHGKVIDLSRGAYAYLQMVNNESVVVRQIKESEAIPEPILCDGKGHFDGKLHLERTHAAIPSEWKQYLE